MDERKSVEDTNAARDKPMASVLSAQLEHAVWQDGGDVLLSATLTHAARDVTGFDRHLITKQTSNSYSYNPSMPWACG